MKFARQIKSWWYIILKTQKQTRYRIEQLLGLEIALQRMVDLVQEGLLLKSIQRMELGPGGGLQGYWFTYTKNNITPGNRVRETNGY